VPIEELIAGTECGASGPPRQKPALPQSGSIRLSTRSASSGSTVSHVEPSTSSGRAEAVEGRIPQQTLAASMSRAQNVASGLPGAQKPPSGDLSAVAAPAKAEGGPGAPKPPSGEGGSRTGGNLKDALLAEIKKSKAVFYNMVVAQAQKIEVAGDRVTFTFAPMQRTLSSTLEQHRVWLEGLAQQLAGRRIAIVGVQGEAASSPVVPRVEAVVQPAHDASDAAVGGDARKSTLREQALADAGVQALLEVFPAEIRDVEEM
jgi:hypothetical protein